MKMLRFLSLLTLLDRCFFQIELFTFHHFVGFLGQKQKFENYNFSKNCHKFINEFNGF
jgi:hypothetical protein